MRNSSVMQDSQDPYDTENSKQKSKAGPSLSSYKSRSEWKRQLNKKKNKRFDKKKRKRIKGIMRIGLNK